MPDVLSLAHVFAALMTPLLASVSDSRGEFHRRLGEALRPLLTVILAAPLLFVFHGRDLAVLLAGPDFAPAGDALGLIGLAVAVASISSVFRYAAVALDAAGAVLRVDLAVLAAALVLYPALIWPFGYLGAAAGTLVVNGLTLTGAAWVVRGRLARLPDLAYVPWLLLAALVAAATAILLKASGLPWFLTAAATMATYAVACLGLKVVRLTQLVALVRSPGA